MKVPVVEVRWRSSEAGHIYGVLLEGGRLIVAWEEPYATEVITIMAMPRHELTGEEVEVPDDLADVARHFNECRDMLDAAYPESLKQRGFEEAAARRAQQ